MERLARAFVQGARDRNPDALIAIFHPEVEFRPSILGAGSKSYHG